MARRGDHRPFLGFSNELRYGLTASGDLAAVEDVRRGAACDCVCPACGAALTARKGEILIAHFAHAGGSGDGCGLGRETNAHAWAKHVLESELHIRLPDVKAAIGDRSKLVKRGRDFVFARAILETRRDTLVPDVILTAPDGRILIVEIRVTHASDADKIAKIREHGVSAIEVDLSPWRKCEDEEVVRQALLSGADRHWLFNPAVDRARDDLRAELSAEAARKAAAEQRKAEQAVRRLRSRPVQRPEALQTMRRAILALGLGGLATGQTVDDGFTTPGALWKAAALHRLFQAAPVFGPLGQVTVDRLADLVQDCLAPEFRRDAGRERATRTLVLQHPDFQSPYVALERFLEHLIEAGILYYRKGDHWLDLGWTKRLQAHDDARRRQEDEDRRRRDRVNELDRRLGAIVDLAKDLDIPALAYWRATPLQGLESSPQQAAIAGDATWTALREGLAGIVGMLEGGAPARDLFGLPLEHERDEAVRERDAIAAQEAAAEAEAVKRAADARVARLRMAAVSVLGDGALAWLDDQKAGEAWRDLAFRDDAGLGQGFQALERVRIAREAARRAAVEREALHDQLRKAAARVFDDERRAALFVNAARPDLGRLSPLQFCIDQRTLDVCLSLLPGARRNR